MRGRHFFRAGLASLAAVLSASAGVSALSEVALSTPAGADGPYSAHPDPGTVGIPWTVNTIQHWGIPIAAEVTTWPPVIGQTDYVRYAIPLQEDITSGKVVYTLTGPNGVTSGSQPICGATPSGSAAIPGFDPNVIAFPFFGAPLLPVNGPCPITAGTYDTGLVPFTISDAVQPGTYVLTDQMADQSGGVIWKTTLSMQLEDPPAITSADATTFTPGVPSSFTVTTSGNPVPTFQQSGALPPGVSFTDNGDGTATIAYDGSTTTSGTYPLTVTASNGDATDATQTLTLTMAPAPAPAGVTATPGSSDSQIGVSWNAVAGATSYKIYSSTTSGGPYTLKSVQSTTAWPNNGLTPGTTYYYVVKAVLPGVGPSVNSTEASATTLARPVAPVVTAAAGSDSQINVSWGAVTGATSYTVSRATSSGGPYTVTSRQVGTTYANNGLTPGMTYYYVVTATVSGQGTSVSSTEATATTLAQPMAPVVTATVANATSVQVAWSAVAATGSTGPTTYDVYNSTIPGGPYTLKSVQSTTTWPNNGLTHGTTHYYVVKAVVPGVGTSPLSTEVSATP